MTLFLIAKYNVLDYDTVGGFFRALRYYGYEQVRVGDIVYDITSPELIELAHKHENGGFSATGIEKK